MSETWSTVLKVISKPSWNFRKFFVYVLIYAIQLAIGREFLYAQYASLQDNGNLIYITTNSIKFYSTDMIITIQ